MDKIMVSVLCTVYNHEKYLRQCLDGIVKQKTNFPFEVIIHDDASTDSSAEIIREYEKNYPDMIRPIYQTENQYSKGIKIVAAYMVAEAKGKYIAICEGDDYWSNENKLQEQFDVMEAHKDCHLCVHTVRAVKENGDFLDQTYPTGAVTEGVIQQHLFFEFIGKHYAFQTSSYFLAAEDYKQFQLNPPKFRQVVDVGDEPTLLFFGLLGDVYYIGKEMSCYRQQSNGSWSQRVLGNKEKAMQHFRSMVAMYDEFNLSTGNKYCQELAVARQARYLDYCLLSNEKECARVLLLPENRDRLNRYGKKTKIMTYMKAYFPGLARLYYKIKDRE